jgi:O-antigen/teichoic acid export membrane protein
VTTSSDSGSSCDSGNRKEVGPVQISGSLIARNTLLNMIGQALPLLVGVLTIPLVVRGLGTERYGLLSLAWVVLGYFTIFDLGLGRATTRYVAEALGKGEGDQVPQIIWTAVTFQAVLGFAGALVLFGTTDLLVERVLNIPPDLLGEAKDTFYMLALSIPLVLVSSSFSGVLEAAQRFDLVNAVRIPSSTLTFLLPLVGLYLGFGLPGIVALIILTRFGSLVAFFVMDLRIVPKLKEYSVSFARFSQLFAFGGWVMITSIVGPILVYLDRFLIGSLLTIAAVAYYTAPYEMVTRLTIISASLTMTLFPAFSALEGVRDSQRLGMIFSRSIKYILLASGPIVVLIVIFAKEILQIWLGNDFATESTVAMQVLALGVLINSLANTPFALLQGIGRPDLPAKFHLIQLPIYIAVAWILVSEFGIVGAAGAWTVRVLLDAFLLYIATFKVYRLSPSLFTENGIKLTVIVLVIFACIAYGLKVFSHDLSMTVQSMLFIGLFTSFAWACWNYVLDDLDRGLVQKMANLKRILERTS